jgi:amino acid adenylation domain-containing protein
MHRIPSNRVTNVPLTVPPDLTAAQTAIWLDQQLFPGKPIYNTGQALTIRGALRADLFETALRDTVRESPGLQLPPRTSQIRFDLCSFDFRRESDPVVAAERWMQTEMGTAIALDDPTLFRFALIRVADDVRIWFQKYHHIIIDATGRLLLSARTAARYRALRLGADVPALNAATPTTVLAKERRYSASESHDTDRAYWLARFAVRTEPLLNANRAQSERGRSGRHARVAFTLARADFNQLEGTASSAGSSASRGITALTYATFARLYDRSDIVLGVELSNRADAAEKQMVGNLARPLPLALNLNPATSIAEVMRKLDEARALDYPHRHFPLQELVTALGVVRHGQHGLFDVIVNFIPAAYDFAFEDIPVELGNLSYGFAAPWIVTIADTGHTRDLDVTVDSDPGLIDAETAARLAACLEILLRQGLKDLACPIRRLPIMREEVREELRRLAAGDIVELPQGATLTTLCQRQAEQRPDCVALISGAEQLTFASLHAQAARLARRLAAVGVAPGVVVGIALPRTPALVVAVLAVHKAGGAYLALDPSYPSERIRYMVADAASPIIITTPALAPCFSGSGARLLYDTEPADVDVALAEPTPPGPGDPAYVLYTSGSTGRPKAVGIDHRSLVNLLHWGHSVVSHDELAGLLFATSLNFDISAFEMFLPLAFGGCIIMVDNLLALHTTAHRHKVRLVNTGPSLMQALLRTGSLPCGVTTVILAGERLTRPLASAIFKTRPAVRLLNCYGPTETTVYSSWARIDSKDVLQPAIGRPIWNTTLHVLSSSQAQLPPGAQGELFIGGAGVARGYRGNAAQTAERFLCDPFAAGRLYRTGDCVRWRPDGELEFVGRADEQLKINGLRIEPGEIEAALLALPGISAAAVTLHQDGEDARTLTAYLVPTTGTTPDAEAARTALTRRLPSYMVPGSYVWLRAMPMTSNGKLDRKALLAPGRAQRRSSAERAPETGIEQELARIWEDVLGSAPPSVSADFFDLGGDSLALLNLLTTLEARFGRRLSVDILAGGLTILKLTQVLAEAETLGAEMEPLIALQSQGERPPFFCVPGVGADVLHLHRLSVHMGSNRPFYAFRWTRKGAAAQTMSDIAAGYVSAMIAIQPTGPFYLGGYCLGALVAYEMAQQLSQRGHNVGMLAILDQRSYRWRLTASGLLPALYHALVNVFEFFRDAPTLLDACRRIARVAGKRPRNWAQAAIGLQPGTLQIEVPAPGEAHLPALRGYRAVASSVPITLFRAIDTALLSLPLDRTLGWDRFTRGRVRVCKVPGDHVSITTEPLVRYTAKALSDELDTAQGMPHAPARVVEPHPIGQSVRT